MQLKVCQNRAPHLRGNVYVQYRRLEDAIAAYQGLNGRWYAGKQITIQFSPVTNWKLAICGLYDKNQCPHGKACNFLHPFRNPKGEYEDNMIYYRRSNNTISDNPRNAEDRRRKRNFDLSTHHSRHSYYIHYSHRSDNRHRSRHNYEHEQEHSPSSPSTTNYLSNKRQRTSSSSDRESTEKDNDTQHLKRQQTLSYPSQHVQSQTKNVSFESESSSKQCSQPPSERGIDIEINK